MEDFFKKWLSAWSGNQPEKLCEFYTSDAYYSDPHFPKGLKGIKNIQNYFTKLLSKNPHWKLSLIHI